MKTQQQMTGTAVSSMMKEVNVSNTNLIVKTPATSMENAARVLPMVDLQEYLSEHFQLIEFVRSGTAIRLHIDNRPSPVVVERLRALCVNVLEPLRRRFGVIRITSGYRCYALNKAVGGVSNSQHLVGEAADLHVGGREAGQKVFDFIRQNLDFDQLLFEHRRSDGARWLHVSYKSDGGKNRRQALMMRV